MGMNKEFGNNGFINNNTDQREENDYYATEPKAVELLLEIEEFNNNIWEPCCGEGHLSKVLIKNGYNVKSTDLIDRGYGIGNVDFLQQTEKWNGDIITNPPYDLYDKCIEKSLELVEEGCKIAFFLPFRYVEGKGRKDFYQKNPPKAIWVSSSRLKTARNGDFINVKSSPTLYCWFIFVKGFKGETTLKWFN